MSLTDEQAAALRHAITEAGSAAFHRGQVSSRWTYDHADVDTWQAEHDAAVKADQDAMAAAFALVAELAGYRRRPTARR